MREIVLVWLQGNWLDLVQVVAMIVGFVAAYLKFRDFQREQQIANSITITEAHREVWGRLIDNPDLQRLLDPQVDLAKNPAKVEEMVFVRFVALHYSCLLEAAASRKIRVRPGLQQELGGFFRLPLPRQIWQEVKQSQDTRLVRFIDKAIAS